MIFIDYLWWGICAYSQHVFLPWRQRVLKQDWISMKAIGMIIWGADLINLLFQLPLAQRLTRSWGELAGCVAALWPFPPPVDGLLSEKILSDRGWEEVRPLQNTLGTDSYLEGVSFIVCLSRKQEFSDRVVTRSSILLNHNRLMQQSLRTNRREDLSVSNSSLWRLPLLSAWLVFRAGNGGGRVGSSSALLPTIHEQ